MKQDERFLRLPEVIAKVGLSRSEIYRQMEAGKFPKSKSITPRCAIWVQSEIHAWMENVIAR